jgi:hypothetical protein
MPIETLPGTDLQHYLISLDPSGQDFSTAFPQPSAAEAAASALLDT